jgi:hypothetical protein
MLDGMLRGLVYVFYDGFASGIVGAFLPILTFPFGIMSTLLIYYDLKMRKALA